LQTVAGEKSVVDACTQLNVSEARFHELRSEVLQAAIAQLEARPKGRPPQQLSAEEARIAQLEKQVTELKVDLRATQIREELALLMPHVLKPRKNSEQERRKRLDELQDAQKKRNTLPIHCHTTTSNGEKNSTLSDSNRSGTP
jgi:succinate dehydrogenase/fumarate reductase flavoprotein subunit